MIYSGDAGRLAEHYRDVSRDRYEGKKCLEGVQDIAFSSLEMWNSRLFDDSLMSLSLLSRRHFRYSSKQDTNRGHDG